MSYLKTLIISAAVALAIIFMVQNMDALSHPLAVRLNLFVVHLQTTPYPTYMVILLSFFAGLLVASLLGITERFRLRGRIKAEKKKSAELSRELNSLRTLPITGETMGEQQEPEPEPAPMPEIEEGR